MSANQRSSYESHIRVPFYPNYGFKYNPNYPNYPNYPPMHAPNMLPRMWSPNDAYYRPHNFFAINDHSANCCLSPENKFGCRQQSVICDNCRTVVQQLNDSDESERLSPELVTAEEVVTQSSYQTCGYGRPPVGNVAKTEPKVNEATNQSLDNEVSNTDVVPQYVKTETVANETLFSKGLRKPIICEVGPSLLINNAFIKEPIRCQTNVDPIRYKTIEEPIRYQTNEEPIRYQTKEEPIRYETKEEPILFETNVEPIRYQTNEEPILFETNVEPITENLIALRLTPSPTDTDLSKEKLFESSLTLNITNELSLKPNESPIKFVSKDMKIIRMLRTEHPNLSDEELYDWMMKTKHMFLENEGKGFTGKKLSHIVCAVSKYIETEMASNPKTASPKAGPNQTTNEEMANECGLCHRIFITIGQKIELSCKHIFHFECLQEWANNNDRCPNCLHSF